MMENPKNRKWKVLTSEYLAREPWFTVRHESLELPDGRRIPDYYVLEYPDWINVIAITRVGRFVFIDQYRHGLGETSYEIPAGVSEPSDGSMLAAAQRELAEETGYGVVNPAEGDLVLDAPDMVRQGRGCGIRLKGNAASYHIMKIEVKSEVNPVLGTAMGSEELVKGMLDKYDSDPESLWSTDLFGKTFRDMVREGLNAKVVAMPEDAKRKMRRTVTRIVNEGRGGVICILL